MEIRILGAGCPRCQALEQLVFNSLAELKIAADVSKVEDVMKIMEYGVKHTPALVINGKVVLSGRIPSLYEIKNLLMQYQ